MKGFFVLSVCVLLFGSSVYGQDITAIRVPDAVADSFHQTFPDAKNIEWELEALFYRAKFETGTPSTKQSIWYDTQGRWVRHEEKILKGDLPAKVLDSMYMHFSGFRLDNEIEKLTERHQVTYTLELTKDASEWKVVYDADGKMLRKYED